MNKTAVMLAIALAATAFVVAAPSAAADDTIPECLVLRYLEDRHNPLHCVEDCTPPEGDYVHCHEHE